RFGGRRGRYGGQIEGVRPQIVGGAGVLLDVKVRGHAAPPPGVTPCGTSLRHASSFAVPTWGFLAVTGHPPGVTPCGTSLRHASSFTVPTWGFLAVTRPRPGLTPCAPPPPAAPSLTAPTWGFLAVTGHPPGVTPCGTSLRHASSFTVPTWGFLAVTPARPGRRGSPPRSSVPPCRAACRCGGRWRRRTCGLPCRRTGGSSRR